MPRPAAGQPRAPALPPPPRRPALRAGRCRARGRRHCFRYKRPGKRSVHPQLEGQAACGGEAGLCSPGRVPRRQPGPSSAVLLLRGDIPLCPLPSRLPPGLRPPPQVNISSLTAARLDKWGADLWLLSPPCQPYTRRGLQKQSGDARATSFLSILDLLPQLKARACWAERENRSFNFGAWRGGPAGHGEPGPG